MVREAGLNEFGYGLLRSNRIDESVKVFELNVELFPQSWNTYDSLAEALEKKGDIEAAIRNDELSVKLNPDNVNAANRVKALREKK